MANWSLSAMTVNGHSIVKRPTGVFDSDKELPFTVPDLTAEWFTNALRHNVEMATVTKEIHGSASKILVDLKYASDDASDDDELPTKICVKAGFNPALLKVHPALLVAYRLETGFYYHIAPQIPQLTLPQAYFTGTDRVNGQGLIIMEDLTAAGATFGNILEAPWPVSRVRAGVKQLALTHAETWGANASERYPWVATTSFRDVIESLWQPEHWQERYFTDACPPGIHTDLRDRARVVAAFHTLWKTPNMSMQALTHGDAHLNNTYITADGQPGFVDWQCMHTNSVIHDVAYFITGAMVTEQRREHERELLQGYLNDLEEAGGPKFTIEDVLDEFRRQQLHGFVWSLTPPSMQPKEVVDAFSQRHAQAIIDHGSLELIESQTEYEALKEGM